MQSIGSQQAVYRQPRVSTSENNFADVATECSSHHQGESERSAKQRCYL